MFAGAVGIFVAVDAMFEVEPNAGTCGGGVADLWGLERISGERLRRRLGPP